VDVGSIPPTAGWRSVPAEPGEIEQGTIQRDLEVLAGSEDLSRAVFLFHAPPYGSALDRAALNGRMVDQAPLDLHIGSIAVRRFIEERRPYLTLHGHAHESARLTGRWRERIGATWCLSAAHDGPELAVVRFPLAEPASADRLLL
jgi:Icc-related predicted phosphoesterase